jgi:hypothetical protein
VHPKVMVENIFIERHDLCEQMSNSSLVLADEVNHVTETGKSGRNDKTLD